MTTAVPPTTNPPAPASPRPNLTAGDLAELMSAFNDVTGKLQATHEQLRSEVARLSRELRDANEQLERASRLAALGEMAAGIAHEIRNPLGSISLFARMLRDDLNDRPEQHKLAEKIMTATRGLNAVVGDVLTFSREFRVAPEPLHVPSLIDRALESCQHDGVEGWQTVCITRTERPADFADLQGDESLLQQALTNIIRNAIEAMVETASPAQSDRTLRIESKRRQIAVRAGKREKFACIIVRDSGPGLSPEVLTRMFNPFFTTRKAGTGLGLAIVHRIMDAHAGRVVAGNNSDGPGATIELQLPLARAERHNQRAESSGPAPSVSPMEPVEQTLPLVAIAAAPDRRLSGAA
jgi:signal transduction histidine kinase